MNIIKISQLPTTNALAGNELIPVVQAGITKIVESSLLITPVDVTPVDGHRDIPISSDWAYDQEARINTLYEYLTYVPSKIIFFRVNNMTEIVLEKGGSLQNPVFSWALSGSAPYILNISGIGNVPITSTGYVSDDTYTQNADWTLTAADKNPLNMDVYAEQTVTLRFKDKAYWGVSTNLILTNSEVLALGGSGFSDELKRTVTYNATGGRYPYYVYPERFGPINKAFVNGLSFSDFTEQQMTVTNIYGVSSTYRVVRFDNLQHGSSIEVSWS